MQVIQESIIEKAKDFISKHKGKLIAAAGLAALAGAGYYAYNHFNNSTDTSKTLTDNSKTPADTSKTLTDNSKTPADTSKTLTDNSKTPADTSKTLTDNSKTPAVNNNHNKISGPTLEQRKALIRKMRQEAKKRWDLAENIWKKTGKLPVGVDMNRVTIKLNNNTKNIVNKDNTPSFNNQGNFESRDINTDEDF